MSDTRYFVRVKADNGDYFVYVQMGPETASEMLRSGVDVIKGHPGMQAAVYRVDHGDHSHMIRATIQ